MTALALIRHAPTTWNEAGRIQGREDTPLSEAGRQEAAARRLPADFAGFDVFASPLNRAMDTARLMGLDPRPERRLIEMDWGRWSGRTLAELRADGGGATEDNEGLGLDFTPPEGESPRDVQRRLMTWFADIARTGRPAVAMTHKGVIRAALALATGWDMTGKSPAKLDWSAAQLFDLGDSGQPRVARLNLPLRRQTSRGRVMFYVQHLLGTGHLRRAAVISGALVKSGFDVDLVSGGLPIPDVDIGGAKLWQLPPLRSYDDTFKILIDDKGAVADDAYKQLRRTRLLDIFHARQPDVLMFELFPFGRRTLQFELLPLLEDAYARRPRPLIVSSVRDVLTREKKPDRVTAMADIASARFDHVLVHGDPRLIGFEASFAEAGRIADKLTYTGYVVALAMPGPPTGEVVVSHGGGAMSAHLLEAAAAARGRSRLGGTWRLLLGPNLDRDSVEGLYRRAGGGIVVEPARADFRRLLAGCDVSISQGGYNTTMDMLVANTRSVIVPFEGRDETEQIVRTEKLAAMGLTLLLRERDLTPESLARAADAAADMKRPDATLDLEGAPATARLLGEWLGRR